VPQGSVPSRRAALGAEWMGSAIEPVSPSYCANCAGFGKWLLRLDSNQQPSGYQRSPRVGAVTDTRNLVRRRNDAMVARTRRGKLRPNVSLARSCPFNSMAPVLAITDLVADVAVCRR
jgi:hypothetical protein